MNLNKSNSIILSSFVDRDMLMRYHWGLGIGHQYAHTTASVNSQSFSPSPSHSNGSAMEDYRNLTDEVNEGDHSAVEQDLEAEAEPDSGLDEKSDSESALGDHAD